MLEKLFKLQENRTTVRSEVLGGLTSFLACLYIIIVNPIILSQAGMPQNALVTTTVLLAFVGTLMMGLFANNPIVIAPGMGLNAFFTFTLVIGMKLPWPVALGTVFWSGVLFVLLSLFKVRDEILKAIPADLRHAISVGIGLFITFIGLSNAGFIVDHPVTLVTRGALSSQIIIFLLGLFLTVLLVIRKIPGALLLGIFATTLLASFLGRGIGEAVIVKFPETFLAFPDFSLIGEFNWRDSLKLSLIPIIFTFAFTDLFDSLSTFISVAEGASLLDEKGEPKNVRRSLVVDAFATLLSGFFGTSSGTAYIESATGVYAGARTGLASVVTALLFLPFLFLSPLVTMIPSVATAPVLVLVGLFMCGPILKINWKDLEIAFPCFLAMVLIPLTYSITQGIIWGLLFWTLIKFALGKFQEVSITLLIINIFSLLTLAIH